MWLWFYGWVLLQYILAHLLSLSLSLSLDTLSFWKIDIRPILHSTRLYFIFWNVEGILWRHTKDNIGTFEELQRVVAEEQTTERAGRSFFRLKLLRNFKELLLPNGASELKSVFTIIFDLTILKIRPHWISSIEYFSTTFLDKCTFWTVTYCIVFTLMCTPYACMLTQTTCMVFFLLHFYAYVYYTFCSWLVMCSTTLFSHYQINRLCWVPVALP